ncbi:unnamed protein product [Ambrosiozyma monospora]|uniref:Unnamed protein product n=1 Tax=Ambrosiozyma monospora TaxID=43982 RepID=A0A9W6YXY5_AMBMO|nr:unnamed protein product [Ambrosiozyma monospora]
MRRRPSKNNTRNVNLRGGRTGYQEQKDSWRPISRNNGYMNHQNYQNHDQNYQVRYNDGQNTLSNPFSSRRYPQMTQNSWVQLQNNETDRLSTLKQLQKQTMGQAISNKLTCPISHSNNNCSNSKEIPNNQNEWNQFNMKDKPATTSTSEPTNPPYASPVQSCASSNSPILGSPSSPFFSQQPTLHFAKATSTVSATEMTKTTETVPQEDDTLTPPRSPLPPSPPPIPSRYDTPNASLSPRHNDEPAITTYGIVKPIPVRHRKARTLAEMQGKRKKPPPKEISFINTDNLMKTDCNDQCHDELESSKKKTKEYKDKDELSTPDQLEFGINFTRKGLPFVFVHSDVKHFFNPAIGQMYCDDCEVCQTAFKDVKRV